MTSLPLKITRTNSSHPKLDDDAWQLFCEHFSLFPWKELPDEAIGFELGCGDGLWASLVSQGVGLLHGVEPSEGLLEKARVHVGDHQRCQLHAAPLEDTPFPEDSMDFGYSIAALSSASDPAVVLKRAVQKLKPGAPMMVYLLYALDNRPPWFRAVWKFSDRLRHKVAGQPEFLRRRLTDAIAALVYLPLAKTASTAERLGLDVEHLPLSPYRSSNFETMRDAAWERFANTSERRFSRIEIREIMGAAGLERVTFLDEPPYWTALGYRPPSRNH